MHGLEKCFAYAFNGTARFPGYLLPEPHLIDGPFLLGDTEFIRSRWSMAGPTY